jgi:peptidoglycan hydrolase-like protein with peptidoglycan-binding domain
MKKYLSLDFSGFLMGLLMLGMMVPSVVSAVDDVDPNPTTSTCVALSSINLRYQSRDSNTNGEVSTLQDFLQSKGYLNSEPTGYFGLLTLNAVKSFQRANGIDPTGYVGPLTRAKIKAVSCNGGSSDPVGYPTDPVSPFNPTFPAGCSSNSGYSTITGQPCNGPTTIAYPAGCTSQSGYSATTGQPCNGQTTPIAYYPPGCSSFSGFSTTTGLSCNSKTTSPYLPPPSPDLTITTNSLLPNAKVGTYYLANIVATGFAIPFSWSLSGTSLPPGMNLLPGDNIGISGTPTVAGTYSFTLTKSSGSQTTSKQFFLTVDPVAIGTTPLSASLTVNDKSNVTMMTVNVGDSLNYRWIATGADRASSNYYVSPSYTSTNNCGGLIGSGPFTWVANNLNGTERANIQSCQAGHTYTIYYNAYKGSAMVSSPATIAVNSTTTIVPPTTSPLTITTPSPLPNAKSGQAYSVALSASGGDYSYSWSVNNGAASFPVTGLGFSAALGTRYITGIPADVYVNGVKQTIPYTFSFNIAVISGSQTTTKQFTLTVDPATVTTTPTSPISNSLTVNGQGYGPSITTNVGSTVNYVWKALGATTASSNYYVYPGYTSTNNCGGLIGSGPFTWVANNMSGSESAVIQSCQAGHTYYLYYNASNGTTNVSSPATVAVAQSTTVVPPNLIPPTVSLTATKVGTGDPVSVNVSWTSSCQLNNENLATTSGTKTVSIDKTTTFSVWCSGLGGTATSNTVTISVTPPTTAISNSLTVNGQGYGPSITTNVGSTVNYVWKALGATTASSNYYVYPAYTSTNNCAGMTGSGPFTWVANNMSGSESAVIQSCQAGRTYYIYYNASNGTTNVSSPATVTVN